MYFRGVCGTPIEPMSRKEELLLDGIVCLVIGGTPTGYPAVHGGSGYYRGGFVFSNEEVEG